MSGSDPRRFVRSWFNRAPLGAGKPLAAARTTTSTGYVETSTADRTEFLLWADEASVLNCCVTGHLSLSAAGTGYLGLCTSESGGAFVAGQYIQQTDGPVTVQVPASRTFTEGYHWIGLMLLSSSASITVTLTATGYTQTRVWLG